MSRPSLRGVLMGRLLIAGLLLGAVGTAVEHLQTRKALEERQTSRAEALTNALTSTVKNLADTGEFRLLVKGLVKDSEVAALVVGDPARVLAGSKDRWRGRRISEVPELEGSGVLASILAKRKQTQRYDPALDRMLYLSPVDEPGPVAIGMGPVFALVQLDQAPLRRALWARTLSVSCFGIGMLGILGLVMRRITQRHAVGPLVEMEKAVSLQTAGDENASVPGEFTTREFTAFGGALDEMLHTRNRAHKDLQRSEAELRLLGQITRIADRAEDFDEALRSCCARICRFLCWPVGHVYVLDDDDRGLLRPSNIWHVSCPELATEFVSDTSMLNFREGEDLAGRVLERKEPVWVTDCWEEEWFTRSTPDSSMIRAAAGFPIFMAQEVVAVLELFDVKPREREVRPVALMHNIGLTLGQVLQRRQHHELLVRRNRELVDAMQVAVSATQAKSAFLANMSHEIRTPLTAIVGYAELLASSKSEEERFEYVSTICRNGELLLQLINDVLDVSKIEAGRLEVEKIECSPAEILQSVVQVLSPRAREKQLQFEVGYDGSVPERITTDPTRLHQILLNLISNAVKFTEQGSVKIVAGLVTPADVESPLLRFAIEDTGIGIPSEKIDQLFEPFSQADMSTTRRFGGTGLGLSISKNLVELLGGELQVTSQEGQGSSFSFTIQTGPLEGTVLLEGPVEGPSQGAPLQEVRTLRIEGVLILLAEDGPDNQKLITKFLTAAGAKVEVVENGLLAVERALEAAASGQPFDAIFMDMQMPVMDGYQATQTLRQHGYRRRIIALTANAMKGDREKCLAAGCDDFVSKPVNRVKLIEAVAEDPGRE